MLASRTSRLQAMIDHYLRITIQDERTFVGKMIAFDRHLNLVLSDCEEFRKIKPKGGGAAGMQEYEEKRTLGLIVIRGETILSLKVESGLQYSSDKLNIMGSSGGIGFARAAGRGISTGTSGAPPMGAASLTGPVKGVGAPSPAMLNPQIDRGAPQNQAAGRGQMPIGIPPMMPPRPGMPILPPIGMPIPGMPPPRPGMPIAGMPPPGSFGRGMPMIPQQGFPPLQPGQMPPNARPGMVPMPPPMNMMGMPPNQMGYPPPMPPPPPQQHQNFRPPQQ